MMDTYLLDTHSIIWYITDHPSLSRKTAEILEAPEFALGVSIASYWEMAIKIQLGKLRLPVSLQQVIELAESKQIFTIPISLEAIVHLSQLPSFHKDPFDRIISVYADFFLVKNFLLIVRG